MHASKGVEIIRFAPAHTRHNSGIEFMHAFRMESGERFARISFIGPLGCRGNGEQAHVLSAVRARRV
jgi:hypothetical protein